MNSSWRFGGIWHDEAGNSVIEFLFAGLGLQLLLLALTTSLAVRIDSQSAADLLARQTLRAMQLDTAPSAFASQLGQTAETLGLGSSDYSVKVSGDCFASLTVTAEVRSVKAVLSGSCN